ncbi:MAG: peptidase [Frankiales bacterium]|nr:peptidase [Frankiales bacterium]
MTRHVTEHPSESVSAPDEAPALPTRKLQGAVALLAAVALVVLCLQAGKGLYLAGAVFFVVALLVSVVLHEAGHFFTARHYGMKATQFFVGFGPTLWSRQRGETEYGVKAVPAGGFVKIVGMTPLEEVEPADEERAFFRFPARQKTVVLAAGSTMHFLIAVALVFGSAFLLGTAKEVSPGVGAVAQCIAPDPVLPAGSTLADLDKALIAQSKQDLCGLPGALPAPAAAAGLRAGDVVTAVDGKPTEDGPALTKALRAGANRPLTLAVVRDGSRVTLTVTPALVERQLDVGDRQAVGTVGISVQQRLDTVRQGFGPAVGSSVDTMRLFVTGIKNTVTEKLPTITKIYSKDRDPEGFIGVVGAGRISGQVLASHETTSFKAVNFVMIVASLNLFVGIFNLLPLLPLDGGHIAVNWFESARDKLRRRRGYRGEVRRVDYNKLLPLTYGVVGVLLVFTVFLLGADIVNPVRLPS